MAYYITKLIGGGVSKVTRVTNAPQQSVPPSGLSIARNGNTFSCSWKVPANGLGYIYSQQFCCTAYGATDIGSEITNKAFDVSLSSYYPYGPVLSQVTFGVRANRKDYFPTGSHLYETAYAKSGGNYGIEWTWSDWAYAAYSFSAPPVPTLTVEQTAAGFSKFTWAASSSDEHAPLADVIVQTVLAQEGAAPNWNNASGWSASASGNWTNTSTDEGSASQTRWVRVASRGCGGQSAWVYASRTYAQPKRAVISSASVKENEANGYDVSLQWAATVNGAYPVDEYTVQHCIGVPSSGTSLPPSPSWKTDKTVPGSSRFAFFTIDDVCGEDECLWIRVNAVLDADHNTPTYGSAEVGAKAALKKPAIGSITVDEDDYTLETMSMTRNTGVSDDFTVIWYKPGSQTDGALAVGVLTHGTTSVTAADPVQCPDWSDDEDGEVYFGVQSVVGSYDYVTGSDSVELYDIDAELESEISWSDGVAVSAPENVTLAKADDDGTVKVAWDWSWPSANSAEISWADNAKAWESTKTPSTYTIGRRASRWYIADLDTGKEWFVRVRLLNVDDDTKIYSPYSDIVSIDLAAAPESIVLSLSESVVTVDGDLTASWEYTSGDGTAQMAAEVAEVISCSETFEGDGSTVDFDLEYNDVEIDTVTVDGTATADYTQVSGIVTFTAAPDSGDEVIITYTAYQKVADTQTQSYVDINAEDAGWDSSEFKYLAARAMSASGLVSEWSDPVAIYIASAPTAAISSTSLETVTVPSDDEEETTRSVLSLTVMSDDDPLTIAVTGAGAGGTTTVAVERAAEYHVDRPDESDYDGYEGETILLRTQTGSDTMEFTQDDLIGVFDDGAKYRIVATVQDSLGQSAEDTLEFEVHWAHQAVMPSMEVLIDNPNGIAIIDIPQPDDADDSDSFDLYRLSADKPELIVQGGEFGTRYVDPYPAMGRMGGHRIVYKTLNGDYITGDNVIAFYDTNYRTGDTLDADCSIIDFGGDKVKLRYNLGFSSQWQKSFKETKYLGGSVQGDWGKAVSRKGTITAVTVPLIDTTTLEAMRRLCVYTGPCHVRTPEGSSYTADVQASETWSSDKSGNVVEFSLSITRVDPETLDGMTFEEWTQGAE